MLKKDSTRTPSLRPLGTMLLAAVAAILLSAAVATAQENREGVAYSGYSPPSVGPWDVILFEHPNYLGPWVRYTMQPGMRQRLVPEIAPALEDKVSSIQVGEKVGVTVFQHRQYFADDYQGYEAYKASVPSLGTNTYPLNDKLSSLIIFPKAAGDAFGVRLDDRGLSGYDNNITFFPLPEWEASAVAEYPFLGEFNLDKNANYIIAWGDQPWKNRIEVTLFSERDFQGRPLTLPDAAGWDPPGTFTGQNLGESSYSDTAASLRVRWKGAPAALGPSALGPPAPPAVQPFFTSIGIDLPGRDIRRFETDGLNDECWRACAAEPGCKAYTWVKPGVQGPKAVCWLKSSVPARVPNSNCVSGWLKEGTPAPGPTQSAAPTDERDPKIVKPGSRGASSFRLLRDASTCNTLAGFVTASPLPTTGVGWDYNVQLQATGGVPPVRFLTPYLDPATGVQEALSCNSGGPTSGPAYYSGKMMVDGLTLTCDGRIIGQPKAPGYFTVSIVATDQCVSPQKVEKTFVLEVKGPS